MSLFQGSRCPFALTPSCADDVDEKKITFKKAIDATYPDSIKLIHMAIVMTTTDIE